MLTKFNIRLIILFADQIERNVVIFIFVFIGNLTLEEGIMRKDENLLNKIVVSQIASIVSIISTN